MNFIRRNFGSHRAYLTYLLSKIADAFGRYANSREVDWARVDRFVFVCKGNVCRSPYAEARARALGFDAISLGLETTGDVPANPAAVRQARARGIDLDGHRSRLFNPAELQEGDLVLAFEPDHIGMMLSRGIITGAQLSLVGLWSNQVRPVIADPYGKSDAYFAVCFEHIDRNVSNLVRLATRST